MTTPTTPTTPKNNKYLYLRVIQQYFCPEYGWEDSAEYNRSEKDLLKHDLREYLVMGYPTRVINRRVPNPNYNPNL